MDASVFVTYDFFVLTAKTSNTYWDYLIKLKPFQPKTSDNCYVFFIPKMKEDAKNINMIFVSEFKKFTIPQSPSIDPWKGYTKEVLEAKMDELYSEGLANVTSSNSTERSAATSKLMQAFLMDIAIYTKSKNPNFKIIPQDRLQLSRINGVSGDTQPFLQELMALVDGWGIESTSASTINTLGTMKRNGMGMASITGTASTMSAMQTVFNNADAQGVLYSPRISGGNNEGTLNRLLYPGKRFSEDYDYFWQHDMEALGRSHTINSNDIFDLKDAQNYFYHIHARNYDNWGNWDAETQGLNGEYAILTDRRTITHSLGNGLLVPFPGGIYRPRPNRANNSNVWANAQGSDVGLLGWNASDITAINGIEAEWGIEWDWWWVAAGYATRNADGTFNESREELNRKSREAWVRSMRDSPFDVIYLDAFVDHRLPTPRMQPLTRAEVESLKVKPQGGRRQIIAYINIGSAEANRWFVQKPWIYQLTQEILGGNSSKIGFYGGQNLSSGASWLPNADPAIAAVLPSWIHRGYGGSYPEEAYVVFFHPEWKKIIFQGGSMWHEDPTNYVSMGETNKSSLDRMMDQGFDGLYLDNISGAAGTNYTGWWNYWVGQGYDMANGYWPD